MYGTTLEELQEYCKIVPNSEPLIDTMHWYGAGINEQRVLQWIPKVEILHVNDIPQHIIHGCGKDEHENIG